MHPLAQRQTYVALGCVCLLAAIASAVLTSVESATAWFYGVGLVLTALATAFALVRFVLARDSWRVVYATLFSLLQSPAPRHMPAADEGSAASQRDSNTSLDRRHPTGVAPLVGADVEEELVRPTDAVTDYLERFRRELDHLLDTVRSAESETLPPATSPLRELLEEAMYWFATIRQDCPAGWTREVVEDQERSLNELAQLVNEVEASRVSSADSGYAEVSERLLGYCVKLRRRHAHTRSVLESELALYARTPAVTGVTGPELTSRERRVLALVADGLPTREIGEELHYSEQTVKKVLGDIVVKLGARSPSQAIARAVRQGLI